MTVLNSQIERKVVETSAQVVDSTWTDVGDLIEMWGYTKIGIWMDVIMSHSGYISIRALAKLGKDDTSEYPMSIKSIGESDISINDGELQLNKSDLNRYLFVIDSEGVIPYLQLQIKSDVVGDTSYVDRIEVTKVFV